MSYVKWIKNLEENILNDKTFKVGQYYMIDYDSIKSINYHYDIEDYVKNDEDKILILRYNGNGDFQEIVSGAHMLKPTCYKDKFSDGFLLYDIYNGVKFYSEWSGLTLCVIRENRVEKKFDSSETITFSLGLENGIYIDPFCRIKKVSYEKVKKIFDEQFQNEYEVKEFYSRFQQFVESSTEAISKERERVKKCVERDQIPYPNRINETGLANKYFDKFLEAEEDEKEKEYVKK